jgi:TolA-binding protein
LSKAFTYDNSNGEALFNLGNAYRKAGDTANALATYQQVIELFPNTEKANRSQSYINDLSIEE